MDAKEKKELVSQVNEKKYPQYTRITHITRLPGFSLLYLSWCPMVEITVDKRNSIV